MQHLKLLKTYSTEFEAELVRTKLEREGIEAMIQAEDRANVLPSLDYSNGINLYVEPEDLDRALSVVANVGGGLTDDMDTSGAPDVSPDGASAL